MLGTGGKDQIYFHNTQLLLSFKRSLYILDNSPSSDMSFANIFSQPVACLFILLAMSFIEQKVLILMKNSSSVISFMDHASGVTFFFLPFFLLFFWP